MPLAEQLPPAAAGGGAGDGSSSTGERSTTDASADDRRTLSAWELMEFYGFSEEDYRRDMAQPYWRRKLRVQYVPQWPVGAPEANPEMGGTRSLRNIQLLRGLRDDLRRKLPLYKSDWTDGLKSRKSIAAIAFLYFACLAPVVAFGGALAGLTQGAMGVSEVLASCGLCGMSYAIISGQPMTFVAPTGLTLAFTAALYRYCVSLAIPFLPMYSWVGCWTALLMMLAATINASGLIRYCTRFTEDVFNALLAFNFLSEALRSLGNEFTSARASADGLLAIIISLVTAFLLQQCANFRSTRYLSSTWREGITDFGPPAIIMGLSALSLLPAVTSLGTISRLSLPGGFQLAGGRPLFINMLALPVAYRWLALLPAVFLATLFFLDQNMCALAARAHPRPRPPAQARPASRAHPAHPTPPPTSCGHVHRACLCMGAHAGMRRPSRACDRWQHRAYGQLSIAQAQKRGGVPPRPLRARLLDALRVDHRSAVDVLRDGPIAQPRPRDDHLQKVQSARRQGRGGRRRSNRDPRDGLRRARGHPTLRPRHPDPLVRSPARRRRRLPLPRSQGHVGQPIPPAVQAAHARRE